MSSSWATHLSRALLVFLSGIHIAACHPPARSVERGSGAVRARALSSVARAPHVAAGEGRGRRFRLREGDLLFQDLDCGPICDAIEAVTRGVAGAHLSHVAVVSSVEKERVTLLEAYVHGVAEISLERFLRRSRDSGGHPKVLVGRLREAYRGAIPEALRRGRHLLGKPYDARFRAHDGAYYCSELVYAIFARGGRAGPLFRLAPMTFRAAGERGPRPVWIRYFQRLGEAVPEGAPGINPGALSRHPALRIVHAFGHPEGWRDRRE